MQISSKGRQGKIPNEKMKGCISAAQMFANKLLPALQKDDNLYSPKRPERGFRRFAPQPKHVLHKQCRSSHGPDLQKVHGGNPLYSYTVTN